VTGEIDREMEISKMHRVSDKQLQAVDCFQGIAGQKPTASICPLGLTCLCWMSKVCFERLFDFMCSPLMCKSILQQLGVADGIPAKSVVSGAEIANCNDTQRAVMVSRVWSCSL